VSDRLESVVGSLLLLERYAARPVCEIPRHNAGMAYRRSRPSWKHSPIFEPQNLELATVSLLNPTILFGLGLVSVPVILHLLTRAKPKKFEFPALQLIQTRKKSNARRLRLRHIWLLLLRMAIIGMLVLAVARPSVPAASYGLTWGEGLRLFLILAGCLGAYVAAVRFWRKRNLSPHVQRNRRGMLRGGLGLTALIGCLLFVFWPYQRRIAAEFRSPLPNVAEKIPISAVLLFDTSPSMGYLLENHDRLNRSQQIAYEHLSRLPNASRVAVMDTGRATDSPLLSDLSAVKSRVEGLQIVDVAIPIDQRLRAAIEIQQRDRQRLQRASAGTDDDRTGFLHEIYLFTDLAAHGWNPSGSETLRAEIAKYEWLSVYLIDVGVPHPSNIGISQIKLSDQLVPANGLLVLEAQLHVTDAQRESQVVELHLPDKSGQLAKRDQRVVDTSADGVSSTTFYVRDLQEKISQGEVRLVRSDPLERDNVRYFSVGQAQPPNVLILGESAAETRIWQAVLAPDELVQLGTAPYKCSTRAASRLADTPLKSFDIVCLVNVRRLSPERWSQLGQFVQNGGGLLTFLGRSQIDPLSYNGPQTQDFLPVELLGSIRFRQPEFLDVSDNSTHPILTPFEEIGGVSELGAAEVFRCWSVKPLGNARVVIRYTGNRHLPALIERGYGQGRTLALTTAVDGSGWSDLPRARASFLALADQIMRYLDHQAQDNRNYPAGATVTLQKPVPEQALTYVMRKPGFEQERATVAADQPLIAISDTRRRGHYQVKGVEQAVEFRSGFSTNIPTAESDFRKMSDQDLDQFLGSDRYSIARQIGELDRVVREGRLGQEVAGWLLTLAVLVFCTEHLVANRFYETDQREDTVSAELAPLKAP